MDEHARRYNIDELAELAGVSRRTVRFYIQEGLIPQPLGVGRGSHYDRSHLDRLLEVRSLQESGRSLEQIKARREADLLAPGRSGEQQLGWLRPARQEASSAQAPSGRGALNQPAPQRLGSPSLGIARSSWRRFEIAPGVELHLASDIKLPPSHRLDELVEWCRHHLVRTDAQ